jgi:sugar/nucleoside kinase (ribokinase family)
MIRDDSVEASIAIVGSVNRDLVIFTPTRPDPGETVLGTTVTSAAGGKGANQALADARLVPTCLIGAVGRDGVGETMRAELRGCGVDTTWVNLQEGVSGHALVTVTPDGENSIIVVSGANAHLSPEPDHRRFWRNWKYSPSQFVRRRNGHLRTGRVFCSTTAQPYPDTLNSSSRPTRSL